MLSAWDEKLVTSKKIDIGEVLSICCKAAVLAPSTHNSQPWTISKESPSTVKVDVQHRGIIAGDPDDEYNWVSLGALVENFVQCANYYNYNCEINYGSAGVRLTIVKTTKMLKNDSLLPFVALRYSEKRVFKSKQTDNKVINELNSISGVHVSNDMNVIDTLALHNYEAAKKYSSNKQFAKELAGWMRTNRQHNDGMHYKSSGLSKVKYLTGKYLLKITPKPLAKMSKKYLNLVKVSGSVGIVTAESESKASLIQAGMYLERAALVVAANNLSLTPLVAIVKDVELAPLIRDFFQIEKSAKPIIFFRISDQKKPIHHTARKSILIEG